MSRALNKQNRRPADTIRRPSMPSDLTSETMSPLGQDLLRISRDYEESGGELLNEQEIEAEIMRRRGGYVERDVA